MAEVQYLSTEEVDDREDEDRHHFLRTALGTDRDSISKEDFAPVVHAWKVPSPTQEKRDDQEIDRYVRSLPLGRRLRAFWTVNGPKATFITLVVSLQIAFGVWQCVKYASEPQWQRAFGWGVVLSKTAAGALYPTFFFLLLSMSRWLSTFLRRFSGLSRLVNFDLSQEFHGRISVVALVLSTLHAIGHLTGTFLYGSRPARQPAVAALLGSDAVPRPYHAYASSIPGWTGITAYAMFWIIALMSIPTLRASNYEIFQLAHLLMFPMIALLMMHGSAALLQWPLLGYFLAFPTLTVVAERLLRLVRGFHKIPAKLEVLDGDTVCITAQIPSRRIWNYEAGQYILLQVPQISFFQWHPFTISSHIGDELKVHIKTDGDWTSKLRDLGEGTGDELKYIGIDGPFGAPAQRFQDFDHTIVVGAGIGITPFVGILADLQAREDEDNTASPSISPTAPAKVPADSAENCSAATGRGRGGSDCSLRAHKRIDFHWIVRDRNYLLWFSDLLNRVCSPTAGHRTDCLDIRIQTHVTKKRSNISTHIFRVLLEQYGTDVHPASSLTGLINPTRFGRPDLAGIMGEHYESMRQQLRLTEKDGGEAVDSTRDKRRRQVGVFFCGAPMLGYILADQCSLLTLRGRDDRSLLQYHFMMEVFG
ncbi:MAG: hypothetical protein M1833_000958 [Piccolia ochrophora]|nr:MAG: hypothetical protein M1833_000958 [Piccolia ochrophora]